MAAAKKGPARVLPLPAKVYLIAYNIIQFLGWSYILYKMVDFVSNKDTQGKNLYEQVEIPLLIFQSGAIFEIFHSIIGIVPSSIGVTLPQVFSRVFLLWPILYRVSESRDQLGFPLLLAAWTITEVLRYLYYSLNLLATVPGFLQWCRYSFFIVLYPIGITGELICCYRALPHYSTTQNFSTALPNIWNFTFNFQYFIVLIMVTYIPVFPQLYGHMFAQRKKVLAPKKQD